MDDREDSLMEGLFLLGVVVSGFLGVALFIELLVRRFFDDY